MADSKRLTVLKALTAYLEAEVRPSNGYQHTLAGAVFRGRMFRTSNDPAPMISLMENIDPDRYPRFAGGDLQAPTPKSDWIILLQGWVEDDKRNPTDPAYNLMADVEKALAKILDRGGPYGEPGPQYMLGNLISGMTMEPGIARPPIEQVSSLAFFWKRIVLKLVEDPNDPYQL